MWARQGKAALDFYVMETAIQASLDLANHLIANLGLAGPSGYLESFRILGASGWISRSLARRLEELAGFRNVLAHHYPDLDRTSGSRRPGPQSASCARASASS